MGTWGYGSFDNDTALDWLVEFSSKPSEQFLLDTILRKQKPVSVSSLVCLFQPAQRFEEVRDEEVIAAIETISVFKGSLPNYAPDDFDRITRFVISDQVLELAYSTLTEIELNSHLRDCWEDAGQRKLDLWLGEIAELRKRLP